MANKNFERDLWWEARQKTRKMSQPGFWASLLFKVKAISLRGRPVVLSVLPTALADRKDVIWFPDLNKYNPYSLQIYFDLGCKAAMGRIGGVGAWTMDLWNYVIDPYWKPFMEQADKLGKLGQILGYWVHNGFEYRTEGSDGMTIQTRWIDKFTSGGYMPQGLVYDHEVSKCWLTNGAEFPLTAWNAVESLRVNTLNTQKKFNKKSIGDYSAIWFMKQTAEYWEAHYTHLYNANRPPEEGGVGVTRPLMLAYYPQVLTKVYTSTNDLAVDLITPTAEQVGKYLYCGFQANSWQFTDRLNVGGKTCDFNVSLDPSGTFFKNFGLIDPGAVTPPVDPPVDPPVVTGDYALKTDFDALKADHDALAAKVIQLETHSHTTGTPL